MILVSQNENRIILNDDIIIDLAFQKKSKVFLINATPVSGEKYEMARYEDSKIAIIVLKKLIDAKIRGDKLFKFMNIKRKSNESPIAKDLPKEDK
jgi:hypothetical protein